jgi:cation:H+ antiporter
VELLGLALLTLVLSLALLIKASDLFTESAEKLGLKLGVPALIIGVTIVALGTSLPELVSSIFAVIAREPEIVFGNVVGSNITNIFLVIGAAALFSKGLYLKEKLPWLDQAFFIGSSCIITFVALCISSSSQITFFSKNFEIIPLEGWICLVFLGIYMIYNIIKRNFTPIDAHPLPEDKFTWITALILILSPVFIHLGAKYTIESAVSIAKCINVGDEIIAISAIALGTSLPELSVSVIAARKGKIEIAVGNVVGSNIWNSAMVLGITSQFGWFQQISLPVKLSIVLLGIPFMWLGTILLLVIIRDKTVKRREGAVLLLLYVIFIFLVFLAPYIARLCMKMV